MSKKQSVCTGLNAVKWHFNNFAVKSIIDLVLLCRGKFALRFSTLVYNMHVSGLPWDTCLKWSTLGLQRILCTSPTANSIQTWHCYPSWCWVVHFQNKAIVSNLGMRQKNVSQRQLLMPGFYTTFLEAINSLSSQRPHRFAILTLTFSNTETSFILPKKNKVNSSIFIMKGNGCYEWTDVLFFDCSHKHMLLNLLIQHNYINHYAINIFILILVLLR